MLRTACKSRFVIVVIGLLAVGLAPTIAWGQSATATISGKVADESGGVLPGVQVTATSPALQLPQVTALTDVTGEYQLRGLPAPGVYHLTYEISGFQTYVRDALNLPVGFAAKVDVVMKIGTLGETVEVSGLSPVVDTTNSSKSTALASEELRALPKGRTMQELFPMIAGLSVAGKPDVGDSQLALRAAVSTYGAQMVPTMNVEGVNISTAHDFNTGMYLSSYSFAEVQFKTTGNNADVAMPGFDMEAVVKSGGNQFKGMFLYDYESPSWQANNITPELQAQGIRNTNPLRKFYAYAADIGGKIIKDKLWFYAGLSKQSQTTGLISFISGPNAAGCWTCADAPPADVTSELPQTNFKINAQPANNVRLSGVWMHTNKFLSANGAALTRPLPSTQVQHQYVTVTKGEVSWTPSNRMAINALWGANRSKTQYTAQEGLDVPGQPSSREQTTGLFTGPHEQPVTRPSHGQPMIANMSYFSGQHQVKVGMELNFEGRATQVTSDQAHGDYLLVFNSGAPFQVITYNYPVTADNILHRQAFYAMDTWRLSTLTLNYGLRWDRYHSRYNDQNKPVGQLSPAATIPGQDVLIWKDLVPRVGASWDTFGHGKTVIKGGFGLFGDTMGSDYAGDFNPNGIVSTTYRWSGPCVATSFRNVSFNNTGCDLDKSFLLGLSPTSPAFVSATGGLNQLLNPDLQQAKITEGTARIEQQLVPNVAVSAGYVYHRIRNNYTSGVTPLRPYSAYSVVVPLVDPTTRETVSLYTYPSSFAGAAFNPTIHQEAPDDRPDVFNTFEVAITKRYSKRWNGSASYWITKNHRWISAVPQSANADAFPLDETTNWEARGALMYMAPGGIEVSGLYRAQNGIQGQRTVNFTSPLLLQGAVTRRMEPLGAQQGSAITVANLKLAKVFKFNGSRRFEVNGQAFNLFNASAPTAISYLTGVTYGRVTGIENGRVARIGFEVHY